jgi:hypothetical protein
MLEIFVPTIIKKFNLEINKISDNFLDVLWTNNFYSIKLKKFNSNFFEWIKIFSKKFDKNLIILCNWEFWEDYFLDYDRIKNKNIITFWTSIWQIKNLEKDLWKIQTNIDEILNFLKSNKLLTNTKKDEIKIKIQKIFFNLSGIAYILYENQKKLEENQKKLKDYNWLVEYESQAALLLQTTETTELKLQNSIEKFENMIKIYLETLAFIFIK